jgi:hypothetical protein
MLQVERIERKFLGEISDEKNGFCIRMLPEGKPKKNPKEIIAFLSALITVTNLF